MIQVAYFDFKCNAGFPPEDGLDRRVHNIIKQSGMHILFERLPSYSSMKFHDQYSYIFIAPELGQRQEIKEFVHEIIKPTVIVGGNEQKTRLLEKFIGKPDHVMYSIDMQPAYVLTLIENS